MSATPDLFYVADNSSVFDEYVDYITAPGNTSGGNTIHNEASDTNTNNVLFQGLTLGDGLYFISAYDEDNSNSYIYEEQLGQTAQFDSAHTIGPVATGILDDVLSLTLNASDDILYFASRNGLYQEKFNGPNFTGGETKTELASLPSFADDTVNTAGQPLAFDQADHTAYFAAPSFVFSDFSTSGNKVNSNYIYVVNGVDKDAASGLSFTKVDLGSPDDSLPFKDGVITAIALDSADDTLVIATRGDPNTAATDDGIYTYNINTKQLTTLFQQKDTSSVHPSSLTDMFYITVDPATGYYYVTDGLQSNSQGDIFQGQVGVAGKPQEISGLTTGGIVANGLAIADPPAVSASGTVTYHGEQSSPTTVTLDPTLTVTDLDSANITSATVTIAGSPGYISGDTLTYTPQFGITGSQTGDQLNLSGSASAADYTTVLDSVVYGFTPASGDPTDGGADTSRTIDWTVTDADGLTSSSATSTLDVLPCYCRGARILTDRGEVAVEELRVGDLAITASGRRRPIVWIGHRRLDLTRHPDPVAVRPVRVVANAFGEGLPRRDLWLSPGHNIASEGVIMPISSLVNGRSVAQIERETIEYWHVELDAHDILLAEGLPAESYLDCGNRAAFANGGAFIEARPDFAPKYWADTCLPLVKQGPPVTTTKARLIARLVEEGHCVVREADAHIVVDGRRVEPFRASETRLAFTLPVGGREITLRSNVFVPAQTVAESMDTRELGICVAELRIDGATSALDRDETRAMGWREAEFVDGNFARRWTSGETPLPAGSRTVIVELAGVGYYWIAPAERDAALSA